MTTAQRIIKYFAIGFAALLIVSIFSGIVFWGLGIITAGKMIKNNSEIEMNCEEEKSCLKITLGASELEIRKGNELKVETKNGKVEVQQDENRLEIKDSGSGWDWLGKDDNRKVTVHVPEDMEFDKAGISGGAGKIYVEQLRAKDFEMALGAGEASFDALEVETAKISAGIGSVRVKLMSSAEEYSVKLSKGIGEIKFNDKKVSNDTTIGEGSKKIEISGGIGEITVNTKE